MMDNTVNANRNLVGRPRKTSTSKTNDELMSDNRDREVLKIGGGWSDLMIVSNGRFCSGGAEP
jgi:hypothetical protein